MAYAVLPSVRSRAMRATTSSGVDLGLPSFTPFSFLTCSASRVRILMKSRPREAPLIVCAGGRSGGIVDRSREGARL